MTNTLSFPGLPDPVAQPAFYEGVLTKRALAWLADVAIITAFTLLAGVLTLTVAWFLWPVTFLAIGFLYRATTLATGSATWGMRLLGIEFRDIRGDRFDGWAALLHVGGYYASWAFVMPGLASVAAMLLTGRRQGLTDLLLGSAAINRPS